MMQFFRSLFSKPEAPPPVPYCPPRAYTITPRAEAITAEAVAALVQATPEGCLEVWGVATIDQYERINGDGTWVSLVALFFNVTPALAWADWIAKTSTKTEGNCHEYGYDTEVNDLRLSMEQGRLSLSRAIAAPEPEGALLHVPPSPDGILAQFNGGNSGWGQAITHCLHVYPEAEVPQLADPPEQAKPAPLPKVAP